MSDTFKNIAAMLGTAYMQGEQDELEGKPERDLQNRHLQEAYNMGRNRVLAEMRLERERIG